MAPKPKPKKAPEIHVYTCIHCERGIDLDKNPSVIEGKLICPHCLRGQPYPKE